MSSSFGITQSSSEASLTEGRESIGVNGRKGERRQRRRIFQVSNSTIKHTLRRHNNVKVRAEGLGAVVKLRGVVGETKIKEKDRTGAGFTCSGSKRSLGSKSSQ